MTISVTQASLNYENFIFMGDFKTDTSTTSVEVDKLEEFCCLFDFINFFYIVRTPPSS